MIHLFKRVAVLSAAMLMFAGIAATAQTEITVEPGFNTLLDAVNDNPGATLILKRGGDYVNDQTVEIKVTTLVKGEEGPAETAPALISMYTNPGEAEGKYLFTVGADFTIQDVGMIGWTFTNELIQGAFLMVAADLNFLTDGCVYQGVRWFMWTNSNGGLNIELRNNIMFNININGWDNFAFGGPLLGSDHVDFTAVNNTYFVGGRVFGHTVSGANCTQHIEHNSYVNTWGDTFFPAPDRAYTLKNNIFFNSNVRGYIGERMHPTADTVMWEGDFQDWTYDTLSGDVAISPTPADTAGTREIYLGHNLKFYEQRVLDIYATYNISKQTFFNVTGHALAAEFGWVLENNILEEDGNIVDPQFACGELDDGGLGIMLKQRLNRILPESMQEEGFPFPLSWRPGGEEYGEFIWPLPFDFKPTNADVLAAGDDGYPLGDLNWFAPEVIAAWEAGESSPVSINERTVTSDALKLMNYPNPFSSVTRIAYHLPAGSDVVMKIYNAAGTEVVTLVNEYQVAGQQEVMFDAANLSGGVYFCKINAGGLSQVQKISLIK
ncbi:MAG: T9SS type A sorting domain-containing protein [Bacteroidota bacterium]